MKKGFTLVKASFAAKRTLLCKNLASVQRGFTLVELLIVMAILSVLVGLVGMGFRSSQIRGRDAQRKSDLRQVSASLELLFSDYGRYPDDDGAGFIKACPFDPNNINSGVCDWGESELGDGKTTYLRTMPKDPGSALKYFYRVVPASNNQKYQIFAYLENTQDQDCLEETCQSPPVSFNCGSGSVRTCNFAVTSSNTDYSE